MRIREKIAKVRAPKPQRQTITAPNAAVAEAIRRERGIVTAIRDTRAQVGALADEVESVQDAGRDTARKVRDIAAKLQGKVTAIEAQRPADVQAAAALFAQWRDEYEKECEAAAVSYEKALQAAGDDEAAMDRATDAYFDAMAVAEIFYRDNWETDSPDLPTTETLRAEWEAEKESLYAHYNERRECYMTDAANNAAYARYCKAFDFGGNRFEARWKAAKWHEDRVRRAKGYADAAFDATVMKASAGILRLQLAFIDADLKAPAPFDGPCEFDDDGGTGPLTIGGLEPEKYLARFNAAVDMLKTVHEFEG